jgi:putative hydrolase of HD superfamily
MSPQINLIFEAMVVKRIERTGWQILGDNEESVGEHSFMTSVIAYLLAKQISQKQKINLEKVLLMSIFHDFHESRVGDVDKISTYYVERNTEKANADIFKNSDADLYKIVGEYEAKQEIEAKIVYEANILALLTEVKLLVEKGNLNANEWLVENSKRLRLPESIALANLISTGNTQDWWKDIRDDLRGKFTRE